MKDAQRAEAMFLIIYLTSEQQSELNAPPSSLLVFIRKPEITLFSPWHHFLPPVYFCSPQSMQIKSFDLCTFPATDWTLNLILLLRRCACLPPRSSPDTGGNRAPAAAPGENSLLPPQYAKATFEWNICLVSEQSSVSSLRTDTWKRGGEWGKKALSTWL